MSHLSNSRPMSRSIHGNAFSWPTATSTSSHSMCTSGSPVGTRLRRPLASRLGLDLLEQHAGELAVLVGEFLRHHEVQDRDAFAHGVVFFPRRGLHLLEAGAHDDLHILAAEAARGAAAIHRGVAAAEHDHALADGGRVAERHRRQPVDADMDVLSGFLAAGDFQLASARRAAADEDRVVVLGEHRSSG